MSLNKLILERIVELDEMVVKEELAFILEKYTEIGQNGCSEEDLIREIKSLYIKLGLNRIK